MSIEERKKEKVAILIRFISTMESVNAALQHEQAGHVLPFNYIKKIHEKHLRLSA